MDEPDEAQQAVKAIEYLLTRTQYMTGTEVLRAISRVLDDYYEATAVSS
jgi:hypothetical protein